MFGILLFKNLYFLLCVPCLGIDWNRLKLSSLFPPNSIMRERRGHNCGGILYLTRADLRLENLQRFGMLY